MANVFLLLVVPEGSAYDLAHAGRSFPERWIGHLCASVTVLATLACLPRERDRFSNLRLVLTQPVPNRRRWLKVGAGAVAIIAAAVLVEILVARAFLSPDRIAARLPIVDRARIVEVLIVAPLLEEIVYRLVIAGVVADAWGKRAGIVASFVAFAAVHFARGNLDVANLLAAGSSLGCFSPADPFWCRSAFTPRGTCWRSSCSCCGPRTSAIQSFRRSRSGITASAVPDADLIAITIGSRGDRASAFRFAVNAAGVLSDGLYFDDTSYDSSWDENWEAATSRTPQGWTAEFRIPLRVLRFDAAEIQRWGVNVQRTLAARQETDVWTSPASSRSRAAGSCSSATSTRWRSAGRCGRRTPSPRV